MLAVLFLLVRTWKCCGVKHEMPPADNDGRRRGELFERRTLPLDHATPDHFSLMLPGQLDVVSIPFR